MFATITRTLIRSSLAIRNASPQLCATSPLFRSTQFEASKRQWPQHQFLLPVREFHAADSKSKYLDFRYRFKTNHLRLNMLIIRRQKMKKHRRKKWRKKFSSLLAKERFKREISKEKTFRVELLSMIRLAEQFDPKEYAQRKLAEIYNKPRELTREERLEQLKELIRKNRYQTTYIKPKHRSVNL